MYKRQIPIFTPPGGDIFNYEERNNYRMSNYHRLDLAVNFHKTKKLGRRTWRIGLINVYNRKNPLSIYPVETGSGVEVKQLSILPIPLPYATYSFDF